MQSRSPRAERRAGEWDDPEEQSLVIAPADHAFTQKSAGERKV
jgi:hypothetical protein